MDRSQQYDSAVPLCASHRHENGFADRRAAFVEAGVGDVHARQLADQRLVFKERLQTALAGFGLVRGVRGVILASSRNRVDG